MDKLNKNIIEIILSYNNYKICKTCDNKITHCDGCCSEICSECEIRRMCCHDWILKMFTEYCEDYVEK